jgi:hypothetical protein
MSKTVRAGYVAALEALKAKGCIAGYRVEGDDFAPEWLAGGMERTKEELLTSITPLGLKKRQRAYLMLLLPVEKRREIDEVFLREIQKRRDHEP